MNNSGEYENNNDYFKDNIDKQEGYRMSDCLMKNPWIPLQERL